MDAENTPKPSFRPPDLTPPPSAPPPTAFRAPDITPPAGGPPPSETSFAPPPVMEIPEEAKRKPKEVVPDEDEVKVGDIAPFNTRIIAGLIDQGVAIGIYIVFLIILPNVLHFVGSLAALGYILTKDSLPFLDGQSIGKKVMKLRAVTADGAPLTGNWQTGLLRNVLLIVALVEFIVLLIREGKPEQGRRIGDDIAKTKVIVIGEPVPPADEA